LPLQGEDAIGHIIPGRCHRVNDISGFQPEVKVRLKFPERL